MDNSDIVATRCPVEEAMKLISKKWVIQIVRDMFFGKSHFNEFKEGKPNLSNKVLSNCLKEMECNGLIKRVVDEQDNSYIEYSLTQKGLALNKIVYELACFSLVTDLNNKYYSDEKKKEIEKLFRETLDIN
ncbi:MAG: helix-turn-helix transcriptional regulator [Methanosphaera stadtmanae]|nr:helix-turn-helix transcriptional regulator [Methanosphaera stadtmanae]